MKKIKLSLVAALSAVLMLTSCLSEGSNEFSWTGYGIIDNAGLATGYRPAFYWSNYDYPVYNKTLELEDAIYVYATFTVNMDDEVNADADSKKYYVGPVQVFASCTPVSLRPRETFDPENTQSTENEVIPAGVDLKQWVKEVLFAEITISKFPKDSKLNVTVEYNPNQTPAVEDKVNVYDFYIRTEVDSSESTTASSYGERCAIRMQDGYNTFYRKEQGAGNEKFGIRINCAKSIDEETGIITWEKAPIIMAYIEKES